MAFNWRQSKTKAVSLLTAFIAAFVFLAILQDFLEASLHRAAFYFSESFLFSSFWWLFVPLLYGQYLLASKPLANNLGYKALLAILPAALHLFAFPALVWLLSRLFYYHTFRYQQTLQYCISTHFFILVFFYTVPLGLYLYFRSTTLGSKPSARPSTADPVFETTLLVAEGNKRSHIAIADIRYLQANPPYINIYHRDKKYLYPETLKSVSAKINPDVFVRIHKSTIVNIGAVRTYSSRLNGDYDLALKDGTTLRLSRNYAAAFKDKFRQSHRFNTN